MSVKRVAAAALMVLAFSACTSEGAQTATTTAPGETPATCQEPPAAEQVAQAPDFVLMILPKTVEAGSEAELSMVFPRLSSADAITGAGAAWQCWDGVAWIDTHQLVKDGFGPDHQPAALAVEPGATTTVPAVGLQAASSHTIVIPDVAPGIYRIRDEVWFGSESRQGYVVVEVR